MKRITTGILAHVDAGKTTLSEGLLFCSGEIRSLGRVDSKNTFLDTDEIERKRGITVFSKQAVIDLGDTSITLLDTPGHIDFAAEAERTLQVLDYAILVISATDGVQGHTRTLWNMLKKHSIPTFVFINKLDLDGADKKRVIEELSSEFKENFVDFTEQDKELLNENIAVCDDSIMKEYLENGEISEKLISRAIRLRNIFPCFCGAALKMEGVEEFLKGLSQFTEQMAAFPVFGAKVFKIAQDDKGQRLTFMKITGGSIKVKELIKTGETGEKINEIRIYSGERYKNADVAESGTICAVTGLHMTYAGQGLGFEGNSDSLTSEPIYSYKVILPQNTDISTVIGNLRQLEEEETQLNVKWNERLQEIQISLMGEIQLEVLKQQILRRFNLAVEFEEGSLLYKETIESTVEGVGHYEPLRHYAEVHLLIEPLERGMGVHFAADCPEDALDKNWQRLIMTHLMEKQHLGVLTGSPITDVKITLKSGKAHLKHTEGGDFRQATYRAVRHGLRHAKSVLLEPYYEFTLEVPNESIGRAMTDLDNFGATFSVPQTRGDFSKITGRCPAAAISSYQRELIAYSRGKGKLSCKFSGYDKCQNSDAVIENLGYNCDADVENTADSVFCSHGAGYTVKWNEVHEHMHLESVIKPKRAEESPKPRVSRGGIFADEEELIRIFERTYGKIERKNPNTALKTPKFVPKPQKVKKREQKFDKEYLLIDGYNIIFAWDKLREIAKESLEAARSKLVDIISTYSGFRDYSAIIVFDAYKVKGNRGEVENIDGVCVVYTKEAQTADSYIEKTATELSKNYKVTVATSDGLEQLIIFGSGALRISANALETDVLLVENTVRQTLKEHYDNKENAEFLRIIREKLEEIEKA